ncbi:MAG TPA: hypothetical protein QF518_03485 [Nitrosopumilus sp.]|nr:hypothetical protein [Nitrosopumilus sp.]HJO31673.1 hypothetical protein [Nitrosopumilus sp.]
MELLSLMMDSVTIISAGTMIGLAFHYMASIMSDKAKSDLNYHS